MDIGTPKNKNFYFGFGLGVDSFAFELSGEDYDLTGHVTDFSIHPELAFRPEPENDNVVHGLFAVGMNGNFSIDSLGPVYGVYEKDGDTYTINDDDGMDFSFQGGGAFLNLGFRVTISEKVTMGFYVLGDFQLGMAHLAPSESVTDKFRDDAHNVHKKSIKDLEGENPGDAILQWQRIDEHIDTFSQGKDSFLFFAKVGGGMFLEGRYVGVMVRGFANLYPDGLVDELQMQGGGVQAIVYAPF